MDGDRWGALGSVVAAAFVVGAAGLGASTGPEAQAAHARPSRGGARVEAGLRPPPGAQDYYRCF